RIVFGRRSLRVSNTGRIGLLLELGAGAAPSGGPDGARVLATPGWPECSASAAGGRRLDRERDRPGRAAVGDLERIVAGTGNRYVEASDDAGTGHPGPQ